MCPQTGVHFSEAHQIDDLNDRGRGVDSHNVTFWDPMDGEYKAYMRYWYPSPDRRGVHLKRSPTWDGPWTGNREFILDPSDVFADGAANQLYTPGILPYHGQYIGLPSVYRNPVSDGRIAAALLHSEDGSNWTAADQTEDFFDTSVHSPTGEDFMLFAQPSIVERDNELLFYYSYINRNHEDDPSFAPPYDFTGEMHIASLRRDGFYKPRCLRRRDGHLDDGQNRHYPVDGLGGCKCHREWNHFGRSSRRGNTRSHRRLQP